MEYSLRHLGNIPYVLYGISPKPFLGSIKKVVYMIHNVMSIFILQFIKIYVDNTDLIKPDAHI